MTDDIPSSREFLKSSIQSHADFAKDLLKLLEGDSSEAHNRFQIASIIIFMTGVDKMLNIAYGMLYLAGKVAWNEIVFNPYLEANAGFIDCHKGLYGKIKTLEKLGADISPLIYLVEMRNYFVHDSFIYAGYAQVLDESTMRPKLSPIGPTISYPLSPSTHWNEKVIQLHTDGILDVVSNFVDTTGWKIAWLNISNRLENLPTYETDTGFASDPEGHEKNMARIEELNNEFIGIGLQKLLES